MPPLILEARDLTKRYATLPAVDGVSFSIRAGEVLGYLGPNGSGKSTTVKMVAGLLEPTTGDILFHGESIRGGSERYKQQLHSRTVPLLAGSVVRSSPLAIYRRAKARLSLNRLKRTSDA